MPSKFKFTALRVLLCTCLSYGISLPTSAQNVPAQVKAAIERNIRQNARGEGVRVDAIKATPVQGIYQVNSANEIFYMDATGRYAFVGGALMDTQTHTDLTSSQLEKLNAIPWGTLPLQHAVVDVHGNGRRKIAVFEDPLCPICRVFTKFLDQIEDITIYRFIFPVIDPKSAHIARTVWCSNNRQEAWRLTMAGRQPQGSENCDITGLMSIVQFGEQHNIANTPTVVLSNGKRLVGAIPPEQFMVDLEALNTQ